jgi:hypothetical protein
MPPTSWQLWWFTINNYPASSRQSPNLCSLVSRSLIWNCFIFLTFSFVF